MDDLISRRAAIDALKRDEALVRAFGYQHAIDAVQALPSAQPEQIARDIATIIENERDMRVVLKNAEHTETHSCDYQRMETHGWIPVTEELPEEDVEVLISYRYKEGEGDTSHTDIDITSYGQMYFGGNKVGNHKHWRAPFEYFESNYEVVAWMPLPEPWRGEQDEWVN